MYWIQENQMWECDTCIRLFGTIRSGEQHMDAVDHWQAGGNHYQHYCKPCRRTFNNENNLRMHLNSRIHQSVNVSCPFCNQGFTTASGVSHHLERGSCPNAPHVDRESIFQALRQRDRNGVITKNLLEWQGDTWVIDDAWNGCGFECYFCHREFATARGLEQHVKSPAHMQQIYHCPNRSCAKEFKTLASLFNHLESESCGFIKFSGVQKNVDNILTGRQRLIGFS